MLKLTRLVMLYSQGSKHVTRRDGVDTDSSVCPLDGQTGAEMTDRSLGRVVWSLWLRHVDNGTRHTANHDHAALGLPLHEMLGHADGEKVGAVNIDAPQLLDAVVWVADCVKVLGEASRSDEVIDLAVIADDLLDDLVDRFRIRDIGVVSCDLWDATG